jgi:hypothetical protein
MSEYLRTLFPGLRTTPFRVTSPADDKYNCIAWAANDTSNWWWVPPTVWPPTAARELTLDAFTAAFHTLGYVSAADESLERRRPAVGLGTMDQQTWPGGGH